MASHDISASSVTTYFIYRDVPGDLTAPLVFFPPQDSDELFDILRAKYPHLKSHSERMRDAHIEFLMQEREAEALSANVSPAMPSLYDSMNDASPFQQSWPSASMTTLSSPDMANFTTPSFDNSPKPQIPTFVQQQSSSAATPSDSQTPAIDQMVNVFSLSTSEQPKQRVRRKMTEAEKVDYRKRRIVKACDTCSKRKRKCVHNQPAIEGLNTVNDKPTTTKVSKPRHNTAQQPQHSETTLSFNVADLSSLAGDGLIGGFENGGYEDFTLMFDDPTLDFSFNEFMPFDPLDFSNQPDNYPQYVQHFNADANGVPCNPRAPRNSSSSDSSGHDSFANHTEGTISADYFVDLMIPHGSQIVNNPRSRDRYTSQASNGASFDAGQLEELGPAYSPGGHNVPLQPTHTAHTHEMQSPSGSAHAGGSSGGGDGGLDRVTSDVLSLPASSAGEQVLNTMARRSRKSATNVARSPAGATPESNALLRHRLRSASVLQNELSSTSVASSSSIPGSQDAVILEGRPAASIGNHCSLQTSLGCEMHSEHAAKWSIRPDQNTFWISGRPGAGKSVLSVGLGATSSHTRALSPLFSPQIRDASAILARPSPFASTGSGNARSTELFRLKNRMPAWYDDSVPTANTTTSSSGQSAQANGGAYPRPDTTSTTTTTSPAALATQQQDRADKVPLATSIVKGIRNATGAAAARMLFTESETRRRKDHHGRSTSVQTMAAIAKASPAHTTILIVMALLAVVVLALVLSPTASHAAISILPVVLQRLAANNDSTRSRLSRVFTVSRPRKQQMTSSFGMIAPLQLIGCV